MLALILTACAAPTPSPYAAPDFRLTALDGQSVQLSAYRGKTVLLNFWATYCVPCTDEMPRLQRAQDRYGGRLAVIGVNMRESADVVRAFAVTHAIRYPLLMQPDDATLLAYQVRGLPITLIIGADGALHDRVDGAISDAQIEQAMQ